MNAGGVAVSALEMSQNSERLVWTAEEVDQQLKGIMKNIHKVSVEAAEEYGLGYNLVAGATIPWTAIAVPVFDTSASCGKSWYAVARGVYPFIPDSSAPCHSAGIPLRPIQDKP